MRHYFLPPRMGSATGSDMQTDGMLSLPNPTTQDGQEESVEPAGGSRESGCGAVGKNLLRRKEMQLDTSKRVLHLHHLRLHPLLLHQAHLLTSGSCPANLEASEREPAAESAEVDAAALSIASTGFAAARGRCTKSLDGKKSKTVMQEAAEPAVVQTITLEGRSGGEVHAALWSCAAYIISPQLEGDAEGHLADSAPQAPPEAR